MEKNEREGDKMKAEFSEFSYGYSVIREYETRLGKHIKAAPLLPSLRFERLVGYDVKIVANKNIFLQFKISEYLRDCRAREWENVRRPYYRFKLDNPMQLYHLVNLSQVSSNNIVRYVAPVFHESMDFDNYFVSNSILQNSIFIPPEQIIGKNILTLSRRNKYIIAYFSNNEFFIFSKPHKIILKEDSDIVKSFKRELKFITLLEYISDMRRMTLNFIDRLLKGYYEYTDKKETTYNRFLSEQLEKRYKFITGIEGELREYENIGDEEIALRNIIRIMSQFYALFVGVLPYLIINEENVLTIQREVSENA